MTTSALLWCGVVGAVLFIVVASVEGALRPGYRAAYHPVSALSLGGRGWVQIVSFVATGLLVTAFAVGVHRVTDAVVGATLVGAFGLALIASGVFSMDPMHGYPPGTPAGKPSSYSHAHRLHDHAGLVVFLSVPTACVALAFPLTGVWRVYSIATAIIGLMLLGWFGHAFETDASNAGIAQRALILVDWSWIALLGVHLAGDV